MVVVTSCDKEFTFGTPPLTAPYHYGEVLLPGRSKNDLARVKAMRCATTFVKPPSYECSVVNVVVRDGAVAVVCDIAMGSLTFVIPPPLIP